VKGDLLATLPTPLEKKPRAKNACEKHGEKDEDELAERQADQFLP
jgi:hypothetical protein